MIYPKLQFERGSVLYKSSVLHSMLPASHNPMAKLFVSDIDLWLLTLEGYRLLIDTLLLQY